ncbi:MAG: hypothetical protein DCC50_02930 [Acidobacteria bacterium]|nr:MAG: hypothetical protein DCC50_02930 [Acidobacteriota bacterium]
MTQEQARPLGIVPANESTWEDIEAVFGGRGPGYRCQCQRYQLAPGEAFAKFPVEVRAARLREVSRPTPRRTVMRLELTDEDR